MNNKDIYKALGNIDDDMILEAVPEAPIAVNKKKRRWRTLAIIAACVSVLMIIAFVFVPYLIDQAFFYASLPDEVKEYADSKYIRLIYELHNYQKASWGMYSGSSSAFMEDSDAKINQYTEVTDNQTEGVIEGDLFKRSDKNIYYYDAKNASVLVYSIDGEKSSLVAKYELGFPEWYSNDDDRAVPALYLSENCKTLTFVCNFLDEEKLFGDNNYRNKTYVCSFDVSRADTITKKGEVVVSGNNHASRMVDGKLILVNTFYPNAYGVDYSKEGNFVPQINAGDGYKSISMHNIIMQENIKSKGITIILKIDEKTLKVEDSLAMLMPSNNYYFTKDAVYIACSYQDNFNVSENGKEGVLRKCVTDIFSVEYGNKKLKYNGTISVDGYVKDQYSFDEYKGILRVVTTTKYTTYFGGEWNQTWWYPTGEDARAIYTPSSANLYCIDTNRWKTVGEVIGFAPEGETAESVRFDGTKAYVCTAKVVTFVDPVFFFDLTDMKNITYTDTGVIDGYSFSLVDFGEGMSLGIGYGNKSTTLKIEIYAEGEDKVESVCIYEKEKVRFPTEYKSYYINRGNSLVGVPIYYVWHSDETQLRDSGYVFLHFNGESFEEIATVRIDNYYYYIDIARTTIIDGYVYVFYGDQFYVQKLL